MYVDESGNYAHRKRGGHYYVLSGIVIHELDLTEIERRVREYKGIYFRSIYEDAELHTYDIVNSQGPFSGIDPVTQSLLLDNLFKMIYEMPITIITVVIRKWLIQFYPEEWGVLNTAWTFITERFNSFVSDSNQRNMIKNKGIIIVDKSSKETDAVATGVINDLRKQRKTSYNPIRHIVEEPLFISSIMSEQMQIADNSAYCTLKYMTGSHMFQRYWALIYRKLRCAPNGYPEGYGLKLFP